MTYIEIFRNERDGGYSARRINEIAPETQWWPINAAQAEGINGAAARAQAMLGDSLPVAEVDAMDDSHLAWVIEPIKTAQSASGRATAEKLGPEGREKRARAGATKRWGKTYLIQARFDGQWSADGLGENPPASLRECRDSISALRRLGGEWDCEYRIIDAATGEVAA